MTAAALTLTDAARMMEALSPVERSRLRGLLESEDLRDKSYQLLPIGQDVAEYLWQKRKRLTDGSFRKYESALDKLARHFPHLDLADLEPPVGTTRIEEFMHHQWGDAEPRTYNSNLSAVRDFFKWAVKRGKIIGDPTLAIERARARDVYRTTFSADQRRAILANNPDLRHRLALRLMLDYALRKGSIRAIQFQHFDHVRKRLTIFAKGGKVRNVPIPDPAFWDDLGRLLIETGAEPHWFLMPTSKGNRSTRRLVHTKPMGNHGLHCRCIDGQRHACISVAVNFRDQDAEEQRETIVHELLHAHHEWCWRMVRTDLSEPLGKIGYYVFCDAYRRAMEYTVDALAKTIAPHMPLIQWPGVGK